MSCECGCGVAPRIGNRFVHGHNVSHKKQRWEDIPSPVINAETGCWLYQGVVDYHGYGILNHEGAHRIAYRRAKGAVPPGTEIDHVWAKGCRYRRCVNPEHLEAVSHQENIRRGAEAKGHATECKYGHPLTGHNLKLRRRGHLVERVCRACLSRRNAEYLVRVGKA